jgi:hypothetical protein|tara:strand:- start:4119 stop:4412 length:294 start_codon:yes stop_codon:yes gene_type:complete
VITYLKKLSGFIFYVLGGSFFVAYMLQYNEITPFGGWWLRVADLPLILAGVLFGGTSLYLSVKPKDQDSKTLFVVIGVPLVVIFSTLLLMNFWPLFG